jgi:CheY-like chemotaxis protein
METLKSLSDVHILIAEDSIVNQMLMRKIVERIGMKVDVVPNGLEVLIKLEEQPKKYDLILMDLQMPQMNGLDATKEIVKLYGNDRPKIFAISAGSFEDDENLYREAGMDDSLDKPFKSEQLVAMMNKHNILVA